MRRAGVTYTQALRRLNKADHSIRQALGEDLEPRLRKILEESGHDDRT
jgi:hypothetical protein